MDSSKECNQNTFEVEYRETEALVDSIKTNSGFGSLSSASMVTVNLRFRFHCFRYSVHHSSNKHNPRPPSTPKSSVSLVYSWQFRGRLVPPVGGSACGTICLWGRPSIFAKTRHISYLVNGSSPL